MRTPNASVPDLQNKRCYCINTQAKANDRMTSRERWTVYPLLFLALGLAIRAAVLPAENFTTATIQGLDATRLICREIVVASEDGTILVHIGRVMDGGGGRIEVKDSRGVEAISIGTGAEGREGRVEFFDDQGTPSGQIRGEAID